MKTVSIIIPTYNRKYLLQTVLDAFAQQNFAHDRLEVVVIVDAATDGTWEMLQKMQQPYTLRPVWQEKQGVATARNLGARTAGGEILIFIDDDIVPVENFIAEHVRMHEEHDNAVVLGKISADTRMHRSGWMRFDETIIDKKYATMDQRNYSLGRCLYSGNFSVPRAAFLAVNGFDTTLKRAEDIDLGFRLFRAGLSFVYNAKANGLHYGYRDFAPWLAIHYQYGKLDVELYRNRGYDQGLSTVFSWYYKRHPLNRALIHHSITHPYRRALILKLLKTSASLLDRLHLWKYSHYIYSAIANIEYWRGLVETLGGIVVFKWYIGQHHPKNRQLSKISS